VFDSLPPSTVIKSASRLEQWIFQLTVPYAWKNCPLMTQSWPDRAITDFIDGAWKCGCSRSTMLEIYIPDSMLKYRIPCTIFVTKFTAASELQFKKPFTYYGQDLVSLELN